MSTEAQAPVAAAAPAAHPPHRQPTPGTLLHRVWSIRWLTWEWSRRDFSVRYRQSALGVAWALAQPLTLLVAYGTVFTQVLNVHGDPGVPYVVFAFTGLAPWTFVTSAVGSGVASLLNAGHVISKLSFPREVVPLAAVGVALGDLAIMSVIMVLVAGFFGSGFHLAMITIPIAYLGLIFCVTAAVIVLSAISVFARDLRQAVPLFLQLVFIATPIMYSVSRVPKHLEDVYRFNPITQTINAVRTATLEGAWPSATSLLLPVAIGFLLLIGALAYMRAVEHRFVDVM